MSIAARLPCVVMLLTLGCGDTLRAQTARTVPVIFSDAGSSVSEGELLSGLREGVAEAPDITFEAYHLHSSEFGDTQDSATTALLRRAYGETPVSLVVTYGNPAADFAVRARPSLWPNARFIHVNVDRARIPDLSASGGLVQSRNQVDDQIAEMALNLLPETREIWLIAGASATDRYWLGVSAATLIPLSQRVDIKQIAGLQWSDLLSRVRTMPADAIAFPVSFTADAAGRPFDVGNAIQQIATAANRPTFTNTSGVIGKGVAGGLIRDYEEGGRMAGRMVLALRAGTSGMPQVQFVPDHWIFDAVQLRRWGIPESRLPAGSLILNRDAIWPRYRRPILTAAGLLAFQTAIIGALLVQRRRRRRAEVLLRESEATAQASVREIRDLAGRLIRSREEERARIMDTIPAMVGFLSTTGEVEVLSQQIQDFFGQPLDEIRKWSTNGMIHADDHPHVVEVFSRAMASGSAYDLICRFRRADGVYRWVHTSSIPVRDGKGEIGGWCVQMTDIDQQKKAEDALQDLAGRLITAREDERARIARDLHDDIGQRVASFSIGLSRVKGQMPDAAPELADLERQAMRLSTDLRHISHELHPATLEHLGLLEALRERCEEFEREHDVVTRLDVSEGWRDQGDAIELCFYRVVQEALRNVAAHADAHNVVVALDRRDGVLSLSVRDDGRGFDAASQPGRPGLGLISLRERVRMLGGALDVAAASGAGCTVAVRLPEGDSDARSRSAR